MSKFARPQTSRHHRWLVACLVLVALFTGAQLTMARSTASTLGTWSLGRSLHAGREDHTATLLGNGLVLVAGGHDAFSMPLASAELYDPATGTWTPTGALHAARFSHTATLLADGEVLVAGGSTLQGQTEIPLASAEIYSPTTGRWRTAGSMRSVRYDHTATLLPNGRVLVAGGAGTRVASLASTEVFNPATGTWSPTAPMHAARIGATATLITGGQVLVAGGFIQRNTAMLRSAELYDPRAGTWTPTGSMSTGRSAHTATPLRTGQVLVTGGFESVAPDAGATLSSTELYDPATRTWTPTGAMRYQRGAHTATLLPDGRVLVTGGTLAFVFNLDFTPGDTPISAEIYDPITGLWTATGRMHAARPGGHTATALPNGRILVAGGVGGSAWTETYVPRVAPRATVSPRPGTAQGTVSPTPTPRPSSATLHNSLTLVAVAHDSPSGLRIDVAYTYAGTRGARRILLSAVALQRDGTPLADQGYYASAVYTGAGVVTLHILWVPRSATTATSTQIEVCMYVERTRQTFYCRAFDAVVAWHAPPAPASPTSAALSRPTGTPTALSTVAVLTPPAPTGTPPACTSPCQVSHWHAQTSGTANDLWGLACPSTGMCVATGQPVAIVATTNGGTAWTTQPNPLDGQPNYLESVACPAVTTCFALDGNIRMVLATTTGGTSWASHYIGDRFVYLTSIACPTTSVCIVVGDKGTILRTADGGLTWNTMATPLASGTIRLNGVACPMASVCYAVGEQETIVATADGGVTWHSPVSVSRGSNPLLGIACAMATTCVVVGRGIILTTTDGNTWISRAGGTAPDLEAVACPSSTTCYTVTLSGAIMATSDGGSAWSSQSSGTSRSLHAIACPSTTLCFAAGDGGVIVAGTSAPSSLDLPASAMDLADGTAGEE